MEAKEPWTGSKRVLQVRLCFLVPVPTLLHFFISSHLLSPRPVQCAYQVWDLRLWARADPCTCTKVTGEYEISLVLRAD